MPWGFAALAVGTIAGSAISASGAQSAAQTQAGAAENAAQVSQNEFNTITGQEQPFMNAGYGALNQLDYLMGIPSQSNVGPQSPASGSLQGPQGSTGGGFNYNGVSIPGQGLQQGAGGNSLHAGIGAPGQATAGQGMPAGTQPGSGQPAQSSTAGGYGSLLAPFNAQTFQSMSPAYQFQLQQGGQGVLNADSSGQGALSGAALKDLTGFNQGLANTSFNNAFNQYQTQQGNIYSRLSGIANLGQNAATNTGQQGTALAGQVAQSTQNVGTALAAGQVGAANAYSGAVQNLGSVYAAYGGGGSPAGGSAGASPYVAGTPYGSGANTGDYCDYALKCDVVRVGFDGVSALPVYDFWYIGQDQNEPKWRGYMAQDVLEEYPEAVGRGPKGFLTVDHDKVPAQQEYPTIADGVFHA
jgi:hypothetical protein